MAINNEISEIAARVEEWELDERWLESDEGFARLFAKDIHTLLAHISAQNVIMTRMQNALESVVCDYQIQVDWQEPPSGVDATSAEEWFDYGYWLASKDMADIAKPALERGE